MAAETRQRMIESAAVLIRARGVEATSFADVLATSEAPRGSIYHHFPGGKAELMKEATVWAGEVIAGSLAKALRDDDPIAGLHRFAATWRSVLRDNDFLAGCTIVAAAVEGDTNPEARKAAAAAFQDWEDQLAACFERCGLPRERSRAIGTLIVASMEGAIVLSRAQESAAPLERVVSELETVTISAIGD